MKRNIDILRELQTEIAAFQYTNDEIGTILDAEDCDIFDLYDENDSCIEQIKKHILTISDLMEQLTEDFLNVIDYEEFDCDSFRWCAGKIRYNDYEIINYIGTFNNMMTSLDLIVSENIRWYKLLTQVAYDGGES